MIENKKWLNREELEFWKNHYKRLEVQAFREHGLGWLIDFCSDTSKDIDIIKKEKECKH